MSQDIVGSAAKAVAFRGTLNATVTAAGTLSLSFRGKAVNKLVTGRYTVKVVDQSKKLGFVLQRIKHAATPLTTAAFVGSHAEIVTLKPGQWLYFGGSGKTSYFFVSSS